MKKLSEELLSGTELLIILNGSFEELQNADKKIADSLSDLARNENDSIFTLCDLLCQRKVETNLICQDVAYLLIEKYLDPVLYLDEALQALRRSLALHIICTPVWFYLSRSKFGKSDVFFNSMKMHFPLEPAFFSDVASSSLDTRFLPLIESKLTEIAPFVKYLPLTSNSHEFILEHEYWKRMSQSYLKLKKSESRTENLVDTPYLETKYLSPLPKSEIEWRSNAESLLLQRFMARKRLYLNIK